MATYYIAPSPSGNDTTGNGSIGTPWATLTKAVAASTNGDTIYMRAGTYTHASLAFASRIISAYAEESVILSGNGALTLQYSAGAPAGSTFVGIAFADNLLDNIQIRTSTSARAVFQRCTFTRCGASGAAMHWLDASSVTTYTSCLVYQPNGTLNQGIWGGSSAATLNVYNCTVYSNKSSSVSAAVSSLSNASAVQTYKNNIFKAGALQSPWAFRSNTNGTWNYTNNCAYNMYSVPSGSNNITSDPLFVDEAGANFALRPGSPCLDAGTLS